MPALRLLIVYFLSTGATLVVVRRWVSPVRRAVAVLLVAGPFLFVGRAMITARIHAPLDITYVHPPFQSLAKEKGISVVRSPILSDVVYSMIPWRKDVREAIKNGRLPLWNRFQLAGEPLLAVQQHGAFHPETLPSLLLPLAQAWTLLMALRFFVSLLSGYLFLREVTERELPALFGAAAWAFCDFLVFYQGYPLSSAIGPFPLLLLGLRRLAREPGRRAVSVTVVALVLMTTAGHPESLLHAAAAAGVYFLFELFRTEGRFRWRAIRLSLLSGALALGLCAVVLLPLLEALPATIDHAYRSKVYAYLKKSVTLPVSMDRALHDLVPYAYGVTGKSPVVHGFDEPSAYAGSVLLPLAWLGLRSRRPEKWVFFLLGALGLAVSLGLPGITDAVASLPLFEIAINERLAFLAAFGLAALAALGLERLTRGAARAELAIAALVWAGVLAAIFWRMRPEILALGLPRDYLARRFLLQLAPLLLLLLLLLAPAASRRRAFVASGVLLILLVQRRLEAGDLYPSYPDAAFAPHLRVLDPVPRGEPWRFAAVGYELIPNTSSLYELEDVRGYSSMTLLPMAETFPLWCVPQPVWFNRIDDPTRPFLSFLNVRYVLFPPSKNTPPGWPVLARTDGGTLVENPGALPRAFVPENITLVFDPLQQVQALGQIADFRRLAVVETTDSRERTADLPNGQARARVSFYGAQAMTIDLDARDPAVVVTSVPRWPGWKVSLDGQPWPTLAVNRAFVGFRSPSGRHTAVLRYRPDSVVRGSILSGLSLLLASVLWIASGRRRETRVS